MQFTALVSAALLAVGVSAGPVEKRNGEGLHLANCYQNSAAGTQGYSAYIYYADDSQSNSGYQPADQCWTTYPGGGFQTWEGDPVTCKFPSGVTVTAHLPRGSQWLGVGQYVGPAWNGYVNFNCYRDNNHQLFDDGTHSCYSVYYCLDA